MIAHTERQRSTAASLDGRRFTLRSEAATHFSVGDLIVLRPDGAQPILGQLRERDEDGAANSVARGAGVLIGAIDRQGQVQPGPVGAFAAAAVEPASADVLQSLQEARGARLPVGRWTSAGVSVPARLRAQGFGRHTFLCGQSGSGKTYALGVVLEQLLLGTNVRMVVLDPNGDFVHLAEPRPDAPAGAVRRLTEASIRVLGATATGAEPLRLRYRTMPRDAQAAIMRLDPIADRAEYNLSQHHITDRPPVEVADYVRALRTGGDAELALAERIENLGIPDWEVWAGELPSAAEIVQSGPRLTVLDLSGFRDPVEPLAVSMDLIERLWASRHERTPTLIVIDEAHNLCPDEPTGLVQAVVVQRLIQIAAEGRKYGLWLLLSTQRPSKIHPHVLSQCDNLMLMRMNSPEDVHELAAVFGFAPPAMLAIAPFFTLGEALVAGAFVPCPSLITVGPRLTVEGGGDVRVPV